VLTLRTSRAVNLGVREGCPGVVKCSFTKPIHNAALLFQRMDHVVCCDRLSLGVLGIRNGVTDEVLEEHLEHTARLLVHEVANALDTATACQTADGWLGDATDVVTQNFSMAPDSTRTDTTIGTTKSLASTLAILLRNRSSGRGRRSGRRRSRSWDLRGETAMYEACYPRPSHRLS
jgi:hypothetical protein